MRIRDFIGVKTLVQLAVRRDRIKIPVWLLSLMATVALITTAYSEFSREEIIEVITMASMNPGLRLMVAPISMEAVGDLGSFFLFRMSVILVLLVALMNIQLIIRHTRQNEATGCSELLGSMVVGRYASLTAALLLSVVVNVMLTISITIAYIIIGLPLTGAIASAASLGGLGLVFAGVAAITVQLSESPRGSSGLAAIALATLTMINSVGNVLGDVNENGLGYESSWIVWLSPIGWTQQIHAFDENNFWIILLFFLLFLILARLSFVFVNMRDVGRGILAAKRGPAKASRFLIRPLGLAWRLQRNSFFGWAIPLFIVGLIFGAASQEWGEAMDNVQLLQQIEISGKMFLFSIIGVFASVISIYTMQALLKMHSEETDGYLEAVLSTPVKRNAWMMTHIFISITGSAILINLFGLGMALASATDESLQLMLAAIYQVAPIITIAGVIVLIYGIVPKFSRSLSWTVVLIGIVAGPFFGTMINLPKYLQNISPFGYIELLPDNVSLKAFISLIIVGFTLIAIGISLFKSRNLNL